MQLAVYSDNNCSISLLKKNGIVLVNVWNYCLH
jgi:hypothetical protein